MLVIGCRVETPQHLKKGHRYLTPRNADDSVAVALAWASHRGEAVDRGLVQPNDHVALVAGRWGHVCASAGKVALIAA
jgi:hypothetical protein